MYISNIIVLIKPYFVWNFIFKKPKTKPLLWSTNFLKKITKRNRCCGHNNYTNFFEKNHKYETAVVVTLLCALLPYYYQQNKNEGY